MMRLLKIITELLFIGIFASCAIQSETSNRNFSEELMREQKLFIDNFVMPIINNGDVLLGSEEFRIEMEKKYNEIKNNLLKYVSEKLADKNYKSNKCNYFTLMTDIRDVKNTIDIMIKYHDENISNRISDQTELLNEKVQYYSRHLGSCE